MTGVQTCALPIFCVFVDFRGDIVAVAVLSVGFVPAAGAFHERAGILVYRESGNFLFDFYLLLFLCAEPDFIYPALRDLVSFFQTGEKRAVAVSDPVLFFDPFAGVMYEYYGNRGSVSDDQ